MANLAQRLAQARLNGGTVDVPETQAPADTEAAYALQAAVAALLGPMSDAWKVGSTSAEAQAKLGTTEPGAARVPAAYRFHSGAEVPVFEEHDVFVEGEFALRLGADLPPRDRDYSRAEVEAAIDGVAPSLEIVGARLAGGLGGAGRLLTTADGGANIALITGPVVSDWRHFDLPAHRVTIRRDGVDIGSGTGARALGDPMAVMHWIANHRRVRGGLTRGAMVSTGTCTGLQRVAPGETLVGAYGTMGSVSVQITDADR